MSKLFKSIKLQLIRVKRKNRLFGKRFDKSFWKNFNWRRLFVPGLILLGLLLSVLVIILIKKLPPRAPSFKKSSNAIYSYEAKNRIFQSNLGIKNNAPVISFNANKNESVTFLYQDHTNDNPNIKVSGKELIFEGVENNIDLRYQTLPTGIKEEIILHQARQKEKDPNVFIFEANLQGAYLKESLKGIASPIFYDQNDQYLFHFEKPFAIDADGNRTDNVSLQIEDKVNSKLAEVKNNLNDETPYLVRLTVDENWLNDPNRKYPITIDPSIVIAQDTSAEFAPGQLNRVKDTGSGSSPSLETYYQELMNDEYTVGLWHLNETGGTTAFDTSSNNNDGTITGTTIVDGILDKAKGFTYTNTEYVSIPDSSSLDLTTAYTLEAWIYPEYSNNWRAIINKGHFSSSYAMMMDAVGTLRCYTNNVNELDSTFLIPNGKWTHVACVWDGNNKYLYINGELNNTGSWSGTLTNNADALTIGRDVVNNGYTFSGSIDEVRVSSIARSAEEIKASASRRSYSTYTSDVIDLTKVNFFNSLTWSEFGVATGDGETVKDSTGLLAQWNFNETSGTTLNNNAGSCGAGCNGTLTNFADTSARDVAINSGWTSNNKRWGAGALMFDGTNDYVNVGDIASVDALTAFSVCAWVNHGALNADAHIISKTNSSDGWSGFMFLRDDVGQVSGRTDTYKVHVNQSISTTAASIEGATGSSKQGVWNYVCGTFTANSATGLRLYVNGAEDPFSPVSTEGITSIDSGTANMVIGRYDPTGANYFLGSMDSLQFYSRVLAPAEILSNYNVGQVELQTRIGSTADANDASWEDWKPITGDAQIKSFDLFSLNLTSNLIFYWPMDESAGNTVFDHQSSNNGTATNISSQTSLFGKAKSFSGSSYITVPDSSSLDITGNFTVSAWVNKQATGNRTILSKTGTGGSGGFGILVGNSGEVYCRTDNGTTYADSYTNYTGNYVSTTSGWTHVTAVLNGTSCKIYINGVDRTNTDNTHASPAGNSLPLIIGARGDLGTEYWSGYIDEVRIYNKALSATEVLLDYSYRSSKPDSLVDDLIKFEGTGSLKINNGTAKLDASTIGLWHLDETNGTGSFLKDSSANLNHGSFNDSTTIDGIANKARSFTSSQYITVPHASNLIPSTGKITMEAWFKTTQSTVNVYDSTLITKLDGSPYPGYRLAAGAGKISCWIGAGAYVTSGSTINDGKWHHAACTNDGKITTVYVDGRKETISAQVPSLSSTADLLLAYGFEGSIDEIKISNTNKSDEEIAESYRIGKNHYLNTTLDVSDLVSKKFLPFYIAADKPGTYLNFTIGESNYVNNQADSNTVGLWHLDEQNVAINQPPTPQVFSYTGGAQSYVVPAGVTAVTVKSWGAGGAGGGAGGAGGGGAYSYSVLPVTPGETLTIYVGGGGSPGLTVKTNAGGGAGGGGAYGLGGRGGNAGATGTSAGGGGGGAGSFVARSSTILVAAGGGGGGGGAESGGGAGAGGGGGANGANGACSSIGGTAGASSTANGLAGGDKGSADGSGGGGAGGGYLGGSGGTAPTCDSQGGAGGAGGTSLGDTINNGSGTTAGNASDIDRGVNGNGGGANGAGTNGRIVINPVWPTSNLVKDESNNGNHAYLALGTAGFITTPTTFSYTGGAQSYVVPAGVTAVTVKSWGGGGGGGGSPGAAGGGGAYSYSVLPVTPGETLTVHVGGGGGAGLSVKTGTGGGAGGGGAYGLGGRGGNAGGTGTSAGGGGGGAGSFVTRGSTVLLAAGGGGGGAGAESSGAGAGGGGGANGANGSCSSIGGSPNYSESANGNAGGDKSGDGSGGGGAGGGYLGGSGGGAPSCDSTGGAGGGGGRNLGVITANGSGTTAGNASDADRGTAGNGGAVAGAGVAGKIIISVANVAPPTGKYGLTRYFNGSSDALIVPENNVLDPAEITIEAWIKPTTLSGEGNFINKGDDLGYRFRALSDGSLRFYDRGTTNYITTPANVIRVGTWHHVVAVGSSAGLKIYVNGQLLASNTVAYGSPNTSADLVLGKLSTNAEYFNGLIDEVRISNVVRSAEEIRQAYELESRTHSVTIDFSAQLAYTNLISNTEDKSFDIDATVYGSSSKGASLYTGDKIIIRENYNGTEYVAQGIVNTVNISTGAVTVTSWDSGSTFPAIGFTTQATVFKWQKEYWPINKPLASHLDTIANLTISLTSGNEGQNIWIDDLNSSGGYLSDPSGSTITSSTGSRYFQYRAILSSHDEAVTSTLSSVTMDYMANDTPTTPSLDSPANGAINQSLIPALLTKTTDLDSDYLRYKIQLCTNADMTANCQTFDQTSSQVGWSGQNTQTNTAYTSGTQATYTMQTGLSADTTYYWRSYAIDPGGSNTWSATQSTPYSFVVSANPTMPTLPKAENLTNPSAIVDLTPEFTAVHNDPNGDSAIHYEVEVNTANDFSGTVMWDSGQHSMTSTANGARSPNISYAGTPLTFQGATYYWRIRFWDTFGLVSAWSETQNFSMNNIPYEPTLDLPVTGSGDMEFLPALKTTGSDQDSDYLFYKIQLCTNADMTANCQTFDQTSSQVGWSGQNTQTNTAYTSGTQATYTMQTGLSADTTYYWRSYAIDPGGSNTWSATQGAPYSFTTLATPVPASACYIQESINKDQLLFVWTDNAINEDFYEVQRSVDGGAWTALQTGLAPDTTSLLDTSITSGHTYQYRVAPYFVGPYYASWCLANTLNIGVGLFNLEGINASGLHFN